MVEMGRTDIEIIRKKHDEFDVRTSEGRERLAEMQWREEESEVWV
jgi:hypothetical protein